jgi:hypothetical protein
MNLNGRVALVKRTNERFLVQQIPATGLVHCWGEVLSYKGVNAKFAVSRVFNRDEVLVSDVVIDTHLLSRLFDQTRKSPSMQVLLLKGEKLAIVKKDHSEARFADAHAREQAHPSMKCPCHDVPMRAKQNPRGGKFWGCSSHGETGCKVSYNSDFTKCFDPDGVVKDTSPELLSSAAE